MFGIWIAFLLLLTSFCPPCNVFILLWDLSSQALTNPFEHKVQKWFFIWFSECSLYMWLFMLPLTENIFLQTAHFDSIVFRTLSFFFVTISFGPIMMKVTAKLTRLRVVWPWEGRVKIFNVKLVPTKSSWSLSNYFSRPIFLCVKVFF